MVTIKSKVNVDTLEVSEVMQMNVGDIVEVSANVETVPNEVAPITWQLSQSSESGKKCLMVTGEDIFEGTMDFQAIGLGEGTVNYQIKEGGSKSLDIEIL